MKKTQFLACIGLTIATAAHAGSELASDPGPVRLTDRQMDAVTAGAIVVSVDALATALGDTTYTITDTSALVISRGRVELGFGRGSAFACCGTDTFTDVTTSAFADGDIVIIRSGGVEIRTPQYSAEKGWISVVSIDLPDGARLKTPKRFNERLLKKANRWSKKLDRWTRKLDNDRLARKANHLAQRANKKIAQWSARTYRRNR